MPAWTTISNALVAVGAKPFATTIQALRDNPLAIAEGATGAPKVQGQALDIFLSGQDPAGAAYGGWTGLDRGTWVEVNGMANGNSGGGMTIQARLSSDNGATWSAASTLMGVGSIGSTATATWRAMINLQTGAYRFYSLSASSGVLVLNTGTLAFTGSPNALGLRASTAGGIISFDGKLIGGLS